MFFCVLMPLWPFFWLFRVRILRRASIMIVKSGEGKTKEFCGCWVHGFWRSYDEGKCRSEKQTALTYTWVDRIGNLVNLPLTLWYHGLSGIFQSLYMLEIIQVFEIVKIITDIKLIPATYLIFSVAVKSESRKIWPPTIKKGKSMFQIHPFE